MKYDPDKHHRRAMRLREHDYSEEGAYFITFCVAGRECLLSDISGADVALTAAGEDVLIVWHALPSRFPNVVLDEIVVMPNHVHAILLVQNRSDSIRVGTPLAASRSADDQMSSVRDPHAPTIGTQQAASLPAIMRAFKSISAIAVNRVIGRAGVPVWQERYYDHVIRDERDLERIRQYIRDNPAIWAEDKENPEYKPPT